MVVGFFSALSDFLILKKRSDHSQSCPISLTNLRRDNILRYKPWDSTDGKNLKDDIPDRGVKRQTMNL